MCDGVIDVATQAYQDQEPGTSGLRKKVSVFQQPNYLENFIQAYYEAAGKPQVLVVGGDGRYYSEEAIKKIINVLVANGVKKIVIPKDGILSTPAASSLIVKSESRGGIILTASHNPGGPNGDFGVKFNIQTGAPAPESLTKKIFEISKNLTSYKSLLKSCKIDLTKMDLYPIDSMDCKVAVISPVANYLSLMEEIFELDKIKAKIHSGGGWLPTTNCPKGFKILVDCMSGVTGPYATTILSRRLGLDSSIATIINSQPLPDFGGKHPDPNLTYAKELVDKMKADTEIKFGIAFDGDGDRNMVLGEGGFFVSPGDALAIIANNHTLIKHLSGNTTDSRVHGFARSFPTSPAVDRVAKALKKKIYETPTGWKYFGSLLDRNYIGLCGEESFGIGAKHIREKDGLWACLAWLTIMAAKEMTVKEIVHEHWKQFGRDYFNRFDYEECDSTKCQAMIKELETLLLGRSLIGKKFGSKEQYEVSETGDFEYCDLTNGNQVTSKQGLYVKFVDGSRIVVRLSGTGSSGATVRLYLNSYSEEDIFQESETFHKELLEIAYSITKLPEYTGRDEPSVIT